MPRMESVGVVDGGVIVVGSLYYDKETAKSVND